MNTLFQPIDLVEHLSFLVLAVSYFTTKMMWLRVAACVGLTLEIIYFSLTRQALTTGLPWDIIFVLINLYEIILLIQQRAQTKLPAQDAVMLRRAFDGLDDPQIAKLLKAADWRVVEVGDVITRQDAPVDALYFVLHGRAKVEVDGNTVAHLNDGAFIGEIAYLTGNAATAKVTIEEKGRLLAFSRVRIAKVTAGDKQISGILFQVLGRDLAQKMRAANTRKILENEELL
ncbi:Crp/Fnr family transcriptional regulator [Aestuariivirga litoralis]|uniref:Crp/Fnr family transcriptional regulator n=1 Tax=Aestuariivirga litoralis TaxID=2650924 RepID=UPI0018C4EFCA|nr:cyclic nucleotide-binding domain-containing protein [Aestuariivirga litoralis]MBG1231284.1 cyclic nucleotide-binding domain-containing protein [Aestuariivirga litoralis]